jgi:transcriptional regulator with XRE-family HTH domain
VPVAILQIGGRIRAERSKRGISLRSLARSVGLSPSLISQIETGKCQPSVSTLYAITAALGVSVQDVLGDAPADERPAEVAPASLASLEAAAVPRGPVACPGQREILEFDWGVTWERLGRVPGGHVDFLLVRYAPGGRSSDAGRLMEHPGTEYGYLMAGELVVTLGFRSHRLTAGDSVSFASSTPHSYRNDGTIPAVGIWFVAEPGGP